MGTTLLYKRACKQALVDTYYDFGIVITGIYEFLFNPTLINE